MYGDWLSDLGKQAETLATDFVTGGLPAVATRIGNIEAQTGAAQLAQGQRLAAVGAAGSAAVATRTGVQAARTAAIGSKVPGWAWAVGAAGVLALLIMRKRR